jgi:hypothetical protein
LIAIDKLSQKPATQGFEPILIAHDRPVGALIQITKKADKCGFLAQPNAT